MNNTPTAYIDMCTGDLWEHVAIVTPDSRRSVDVPAVAQKDPDAYQKWIVELADVHDISWYTYSEGWFEMLDGD